MQTNDSKIHLANILEKNESTLRFILNIFLQASQLEQPAECLFRSKNFDRGSNQKEAERRCTSDQGKASLSNDLFYDNLKTLSPMFKCHKPI